MYKEQIICYLLIGCSVGVLLQLANDKMRRTVKHYDFEIDVPGFTLGDHFKIILLWPFVLLTILINLIGRPNDN